MFSASFVIRFRFPVSLGGLSVSFWRDSCQISVFSADLARFLLASRSFCFSDMIPAGLAFSLFAFLGAIHAEVVFRTLLSLFCSILSVPLVCLGWLSD
jgi:hypothetical protein